VTDHTSLPYRDVEMIRPLIVSARLEVSSPTPSAVPRRRPKRERHVDLMVVHEDPIQPYPCFAGPATRAVDKELHIIPVPAVEARTDTLIRLIRRRGVTGNRSVER